MSDLAHHDVDSGESGLQRLWPRPGAPATPAQLGRGAAAGLVAALALPGHRPGLGLAATGVAVAVAAAPQLLSTRRRGDLALLAGAVVLLGAVALRDATWVAALAGVGAVVVATVALTAARSWASVALAGVVTAVAAARAATWASRGIGRLVGARGTRARPLAGAGVLAATLVAVFGALFASADAVFASLVPDLGLPVLSLRAVTLLGVGALALVAVHLTGGTPGWAAFTVPPGRPARRTEWLLPVLALDAVVVTFVAVQVSAASGGHRQVLTRAGLGYAEYARQGFGQLVAVTVLTLGVLAVAARRAPRRTPRDRQVTAAALAVLVLGTLGVVVSALRRMDLYVDAFGLTRLRLFVSVVEVGLGVVLLLVLVAGVHWRGGWLPRAIVTAVVATTLLLTALNPDGVIAQRNVDRWEAGGDLDVAYLAGLSADAVPALDRLPEPLRSCVLAPIRAHLQGAEPGWGWNLGRARARSVLDERPLRGAAYDDCVDAGAARGS